VNGFMTITQRPIEIDRFNQYSGKNEAAGGWIGSNSETREIHLFMTADSIEDFVHFLEWIIEEAPKIIWLPEECDT